MKIADQLRAGVSGPHERGARYTINHNLDPIAVLKAADLLDALMNGA